MPDGPWNDSGTTPDTVTSTLFRRRVRPASERDCSFCRQNRSPIAADGAPPGTGATCRRPAITGASTIEKYVEETSRTHAVSVVPSWRHAIDEPRLGRHRDSAAGRLGETLELRQRPVPAFLASRGRDDPAGPGRVAGVGHLEQEGIHDAEGDGVDAEADGQRERGRGHEDRAPAELAKGETKILEEAGHPERRRGRGHGCSGHAARPEITGPLARPARPRDRRYRARRRA